MVVLDAVIVVMDMLIKKYGETNKGKKRLCLFTNAHFPTKPPQEGTKEDQVITISGHMNTQGMKMESIVIRGELTGEAKKSIMDENDHLLDIFSKRTCAKLVHVESPISLLGALKTRKISPVTIFRGHLELSPKMKILVRSFKFCQSFQSSIFFCLLCISLLDATISYLQMNTSLLSFFMYQGESSDYTAIMCVNKVCVGKP